MKWGGYSWQVADEDSSTYTLICIDVFGSGATVYQDVTYKAGYTSPEAIRFGTDTYSGSNVLKTLQQIEATIPSSALNSAVNTTIYGVTAKLFAPTEDQCTGTNRFPIFISNWDRTTYYYWWSSTVRKYKASASATETMMALAFADYGRQSWTYTYMNSYYVRPCVRIPK